ncbi:MAG TPA: hypothetical protein VIN67_12160 [Desulfobaccales bacterium]
MTAPGAKIKALSLLGTIVLALATIFIPRIGWGAGSVEVRRLGLSRVGENTLLTVILDRAAEPRITSSQTSGKPQMVVEFAPAQARNLPTRIEGDDLLVQQVLTQISPGGGVRISLDLFPDQPYDFWRQTRPGVGGQTLFILGLKAATSGRSQAQMRAPSPAAPEPSTAEPPPTAGQGQELEPSQPPAEPAPEAYPQPQLEGNARPGSFAELRRLIPKAGPLLQGLERDGWTVSESHTYDRKGQRYSRDFSLSNQRYPELVVKIAYLPANVANTPNIGIVSLGTDRAGGPDAEKYQSLRQWSFSRIKKDYEDIGDFFEDALKPLRVKLREQTQALVLKDAAVFQNFVKAASGNPQVVDKFMAHVREKVNPRFEGVQYTISENPLIILNQVDFLYVKVYFLG